MICRSSKLTLKLQLTFKAEDKMLNTYTSDWNVCCNVNIIFTHIIRIHFSNSILGGLSKLYKNCKNLVHSRQGRLPKCKIVHEHELPKVSIEIGNTWMYKSILSKKKNAIWSLGIVYLPNLSQPTSHLYWHLSSTLPFILFIFFLHFYSNNVLLLQKDLMELFLQAFWSNYRFADWKLLFFCYHNFKADISIR